jgi:ubiquinone/menaquinone biosynthesis C-methylase UbiE
MQVGYTFSMPSRASSPGTPEAGAYFDERAERYDRAYDAASADGHALRSRLAVALDLIGPGPGDSLDAGMGPGRLLAQLAGRGWTVSGLDASAEMVSAARRRLPDAAPRLEHGSIESLPFQSSSFDVVVATGVLEYSEVERALAELARVLRPGGRALLSYPNPEVIAGIWKTRGWYPIARTLKRLLGRPALAFPQGATAMRPEVFADLLRASGLELERRRHTSFVVLPAPLDDLLPRTAGRLGMLLEGSRPSLGRRFAGQVVYLARKAPSAPAA